MYIAAKIGGVSMMFGMTTKGAMTQAPRIITFKKLSRQCSYAKAAVSKVSGVTSVPVIVACSFSAYSSFNSMVASEAFNVRPSSLMAVCKIPSNVADDHTLLVISATTRSLMASC